MIADFTAAGSSGATSRALGPIPARVDPRHCPFRSRSTAARYAFHVGTTRVSRRFARVPHQNRTCLTQFAPVPHQNHTFLTPNSHLSQKLPNVLHTGRLPTAPAVIHIEGSCRPNAAHPKVNVRDEHFTHSHYRGSTADCPLLAGVLLCPTAIPSDSVTVPMLPIGFYQPTAANACPPTLNSQPYVWPHKSVNAIARSLRRKRYALPGFRPSI